ncbi:MAG TPA: hypothetical protein VF183_10165 [Acidimicrobiales bacterium]
MNQREFMDRVLGHLEYEAFLFDSDRRHVEVGISSTVVLCVDLQDIIPGMGPDAEAGERRLIFSLVRTPGWANDPGASRVVSTSFWRRRAEYDRSHHTLTVFLNHRDLDEHLMAGIRVVRDHLALDKHRVKHSIHAKIYNDLLTTNAVEPGSAAAVAMTDVRSLGQLALAYEKRLANGFQAMAR